MSKLDRKDIKIFGNTAPTADLRQFGSTREGIPVASTDPDVLQSLTNYEDAWNQGVVASLNIPPLEEFNTLQYLLSRELAYIQQVGIPEFSVTTTYFANKSIVRTPEDSTLYKSAVDDNLGNDIVGVADYDAGTTYAEDDLAADTNGDIYRSLSAGNIGNALSNPTFWELTWVFLGDLENLKNLTQATETVEGIAKLITQVNADLYVNDTDILTILKLVTRGVSETKAGIVPEATQIEVDGNTITGKFVSPPKLATHLNYYMIVRDEKSAGTVGGTPTTGARNTRTLNTVVINTISGASRSGNQIILPVGTYNVRVVAPAGAVNSHRVYFRNTTDSTDDIIGLASFEGNTTGHMSNAFAEGIVIITAQKTFQVEHYIQSNGSGNQGLGYDTNDGSVEVYTQVYIYKLK